MITIAPSTYSGSATYDKKCDGVADQYVINAAIESLYPSSWFLGSGGHLHLLPGVYKLTDSIIVKSGLTLSGEGMGSTVLEQQPGNIKDIITCRNENVSLVSIKDLCLKGTGGNIEYPYFGRAQSIIGQTITDGSVKWKINQFMFCAVEIVLGDRYLITRVLSNTANKLYVEDNLGELPAGTPFRVLSNGIAFYTTSGAYCRLKRLYIIGMPGCGILLASPLRTVIQDCFSTVTRGDGIRVAHFKKSTAGPTITGNQINGMHGSAVMLDSVVGSIITNNELYGVKQGSCGVCARNLEKSTIANNIFQSVGTTTTHDKGTISSYSANSITDYTKNWTVDQWKTEVVTIDNKVRRYITGNTKDTIYFDHESITLPVSGSIAGCPYFIAHLPRGGVIFEGCCDGNAVTGNVFISDNRGTAEPLYVDPASKNNVFEGNVIHITE